MNTSQPKAPWGMLRRQKYAEHTTLPLDLLAIKHRLEALLPPLKEAA